LLGAAFGEPLPGPYESLCIHCAPTSVGRNGYTRYRALIRVLQQRVRRLRFHAEPAADSEEPVER
jgi:hypothetical protein